jgi:DNA-binding GntR family transcriptional regulator
MPRSSDPGQISLEQVSLEPVLVGSNDDTDGFTTVAQRTYNKLREALLNGEFLPGQSISLRSTAEALGISQMPVRQALSRLQAEGILVMHENRTLTVPKLTPAGILEKRDIRIALEGLAAELATQRASAREIEELKAHFEAMQQAIPTTDVRRYIAANLKFHMCIYRAAGAPTLLSMIETIWARFVAYARWANTDLALGTLNNHARALEGLTRRDAIMTRAAIIQDCCDTYEIQLRLLAEHEREAAGESGRNLLSEAARQGQASGSLGSLVGSRRRGRPRKLVV